MFKICLSNIAYQNGISPALIPLNYKPLILYILDKIPNDVEIVFCYNHNSDIVRQIVEIVSHGRNIRFIETKNHIINFSSTLNACKEFLNCPFIYINSAVLPKITLSKPSEDWIYYPIKDNSIFYNLHKEYGLLMGGVRNPEKFWQVFNFKNTEKELLYSLVANNFTIKSFDSMLDLENMQLYEDKLKKTNLFEISQGITYLYNNRVIKLSVHKEKIQKQICRNDLLSGLTPKITNKNKNYFVHEWVQGETLEKYCNSEILRRFLSWATTCLWIPVQITNKEYTYFIEKCKQLYLLQTKKAIIELSKVNQDINTTKKINGVWVPAYEFLRNKIPWERWISGKPSRIHGDLHLGNIIYNYNQHTFHLIDWTSDFEGIVEYGDIYFDLVILNISLIMPTHLVREKRFHYYKRGNEIVARIDLDKKHTTLLKTFISFLEKNKICYHKINSLSALRIIQRSVFHSNPKRDFMMYFGLYQLLRTLNLAENEKKKR